MRFFLLLSIIFSSFTYATNLYYTCNNYSEIGTCRSTKGFTIYVNGYFYHFSFETNTKSFSNSKVSLSPYHLYDGNNTFNFSYKDQCIEGKPLNETKEIYVSTYGNKETLFFERLTFCIKERYSRSFSKSFTLQEINPALYNEINNLRDNYDDFTRDLYYYLNQYQEIYDKYLNALEELSIQEAKYQELMAKDFDSLSESDLANFNNAKKAFAQIKIEYEKIEKFYAKGLESARSTLKSSSERKIRAAIQVKKHKGSLEKYNLNLPDLDEDLEISPVIKELEIQITNKSFELNELYSKKKFKKLVIAINEFYHLRKIVFSMLSQGDDINATEKSVLVKAINDLISVASKVNINKSGWSLKNNISPKSGKFIDHMISNGSSSASDLKETLALKDFDKSLLEQVDDRIKNDLIDNQTKLNVLKENSEKSELHAPIEKLYQSSTEEALESLNNALINKDEKELSKADLAIKIGKEALDFALDFAPVISSGKSILNILIGKNLITGEKLTKAEIGVEATLVFVGIVGGAGILKSFKFLGNKFFSVFKGTGRIVERGIPEKIINSARKSGLFSGNKYKNLKANSSYETVKSFFRTLGKSDVPLPVKKNLVNSFDLKTIKKEIVNSDVYVYRWHNNDEVARKFGRFVSDTPITDKDSARRLLALPADNKMLHLSKFKIKHGTEIYRGKVAPLNGHTGGGSQIFITGENIENILIPVLD